jgi:hypothetical protein
VAWPKTSVGPNSRNKTFSTFLFGIQIFGKL